MRAINVAIAILLSLTSPTWAVDTGFPLMGVSSGAASYTGPGDIVASATAWYGLRGYNGAYATGSNKSINVRRASDNTTQDINILSSGALDIATANTFAGTDASCTGSMVGTTTLTISACSSGTLHVSDTLTAAGATYPFYITGIGTCASPPGTCTVNAAQTFASEAVTAQVALFVPEVYDQSGTGLHVTQATAADQPLLAPVCLNGLPCLIGNGSWWLKSTGNFSTHAQPYSLSVVFRWNGTGNSYLMAVDNARPFLSQASSNTIDLNCGSDTTITAASNAAHAFNGICSGTSTIGNVDGTETTVSAGTSAWAANDANIMTVADGFAPFLGFWFESGFYSTIGINSTQRGNLCHNQYTYWGTATSC